MRSFTRPGSDLGCRSRLGSKGPLVALSPLRWPVRNLTVMTPDMTPCSRIKTQPVRMIRRTWSYPNCRLEVRDSSLRGRCDSRGRRRCWQSTRWCTAAAAPPAPAGSGPDPWTALRSGKYRLRMGRRPLLDVQRALRAGQGRVNELGNGCEGTTSGTRLSSRPGHVRPNALRGCPDIQCLDLATNVLPPADWGRATFCG
jgi:hypothetical protein